MQTIRQMLCVFVGLILLGGCAGPVPEDIPEQPVLPAEIYAALETMKLIRAATVVHLDDTAWIIASLGPDHDPGETIRIEQSDVLDGQLDVRLHIDSSGNDSETATHWTVGSTDQSYDWATFTVEGEVYPQVITFEQPLSAPLAFGNRAVLFTAAQTNGLLEVTGIAQVYEATLSYLVEDADGNILREDFVNTASGGPDWGTFRIFEESLLETSLNLVLLEEDAADGGMRILLEHPVGQ